MKREKSLVPKIWNAALVASALAVVLHVGCIPEDQAGQLDTIGDAPGDQIFQIIRFSVDFARQLLAAFLF